MIKRILCAIFGHRWGDAGSKGLLTISGDIAICYNCHQCGCHITVSQPAWHWRASFNPYTRREVYKKKPDKFIINDPDYSDQLDIVNKNNSIEVLADIHNTTINELRKIGYN